MSKFLTNENRLDIQKYLKECLSFNAYTKKVLKSNGTWVTKVASRLQN